VEDKSERTLLKESGSKNNPSKGLSNKKVSEKNIKLQSTSKSHDSHMIQLKQNLSDVVVYFHLLSYLFREIFQAAEGEEVRLRRSVKCVHTREDIQASLERQRPQP